MNRIILIGNGFDLAHGLKTSYKNFIDRFWESEKEVISTNKDLFYQIYSPLHIEDFTEQSIPILRETYRNLCSAEKQQEFDKIFDWILENDIKHCTRKDYDDYVSGINGIGLFSEKVWFLNFNYTDTEKTFTFTEN